MNSSDCDLVCVVCSVYEGDVPLRGLQLSVFDPVSGVIPVDSSVQFNITVVDGPSNVAYKMDYGDNAGQTAFNDSTMYRHVFSMAGDFTITASANDTGVTVSIWYYWWRHILELFICGICEDIIGITLMPSAIIS